MTISINWFSVKRPPVLRIFYSFISYKFLLKKQMNEKWFFFKYQSYSSKSFRSDPLLRRTYIKIKLKLFIQIEILPVVSKVKTLFSCVATRALPFGIKIDVQNVLETDFSKKDIAGVLFQYPDTEGNICDFTRVVKEAKENGVIYFFVVGCK